MNTCNNDFCKIFSIDSIKRIRIDILDSYRAILANKPIKIKTLGKIFSVYKLQVAKINAFNFSCRLLIESLSHIPPLAKSFISPCCAIGEFW